jgi:hypothetical protein
LAAFIVSLLLDEAEDEAEAEEDDDRLSSLDFRASRRDGADCEFLFVQPRTLEVRKGGGEFLPAEKAATTWDPCGKQENTNDAVVTAKMTAALIMMIQFRQGQITRARGGQQEVPCRVVAKQGENVWEKAGGSNFTQKSQNRPEDTLEDMFSVPDTLKMPSFVLTFLAAMTTKQRAVTVTVRTSTVVVAFLRPQTSLCSHQHPIRLHLMYLI